MGRRISMVVDGELKPLWKYPQSQSQQQEEEFFMRWLRLGSIEPPAQQVEESNSPQQEAQGGGDPRQLGLPPSVDVGHPVGYVPPTEEAEAYARRTERRDKQRLWVEIGAFCVGSVGLFLLLLTLKETIKATQAATKAADVADQTLKLERRPWVFVTELAEGSSYWVGEFPKFKLKVVNTGRTPGKVVEKSFSFCVAANDMLPPIPQYNALWPTNFFVFPDVVGSITGVGAALVTQDLWDRIQREQLSIFVYGYIRYEDVFGETYWTGFIFAVNTKLKAAENPPYPNYVYAY